MFIVYAACGPDEFFPPCVPCGATKCGDEPPKFCTMDCRYPQHCYCVTGKVRNIDGKCVKPEECPK